MSALEGDKTEHRKEHLKDILIFINPWLANKYKEKKENFETWFKDIQAAASDKDHPWKAENAPLSLDLLPRFMELLRECLLSHQWAQVAEMLDCVSSIPYGADWTIWKASLAVLYTEQEDNFNLIQDFYKQSYLLQEVNARDVVLEFVQYLIGQGRFSEASDAIQKSRKVRSGVKSCGQKDFTQYLADLLEAYQGLISYVQWKEALAHRANLTQQTLSQSFYDLTSSQGMSDSAVKSVAQRALMGLLNIKDKRGVWDIFIPKAVEIHEYYEEFEEARELLKAYRDRNPENPNGHRFMYEMLERNFDYFDEVANEEILSSLRKIAQLDPRNQLVLTLSQKLQENGDKCLALKFLFDLLDYDVWRNEEEGWVALKRSLISGFSSDCGEEERHSYGKAVKALWASRSDWWPQFHFDTKRMNHFDTRGSRKHPKSSPSASPLPSKQLLLAKAVAAAVLLGKDSDYVNCCKEMLEAASVWNLDEKLSHLDWEAVKLVHGEDAEDSLELACTQTVHHAEDAIDDQLSPILSGDNNYASENSSTTTDSSSLSDLTSDEDSETLNIKESKVHTGEYVQSSKFSSPTFSKDIKPELLRIPESDFCSESDSDRNIDSKSDSRKMYSLSVPRGFKRTTSDLMNDLWEDEQKTKRRKIK